MVGLILGMAASLALAGNGVKELRNIRKDVKKTEAKNADWESLLKSVDEVNDILKETTETINEIDSDFEDLEKAKKDVEDTMEKVDAECEKATEKKTETKAAATGIEVEENNSDGKYPAKKKKAAAKKKAAKKTETKIEVEEDNSDSDAERIAMLNMVGEISKKYGDSVGEDEFYKIEQEVKDAKKKKSKAN